MEKNKRVKVQLVGDYYVNLIADNLPKEKFIVQNVLTGVSPFTLCGPSDEKLIGEWEQKIEDLNQWNEEPSPALYKKQTKTLFDLKKNFARFLSRNQDEYCDNVVITTEGEDVIYQNEADYIIVENSAFIYELIKLNNVLYTNGFPSTPFIENIKNQPGAEKILPCLKEDFDRKFYFDRYISTILDNYDNSKIILIKTPYSEFFNGEGKLCLFNPDKKKADFIMELDEYFVQATNCIVVNTLSGKIPNEEQQAGWSFGGGMELYIDDIVREIIRLTTFGSKTDYISPMAKLKSCEKLLPNGENLCDYIRSFIDADCDTESVQKAVDLQFVETYTAMSVCSLNDILAVHKLYELWSDKPAFKNIAQNICNQTQNVAIKSCNELVQRNMDVLKNYKYIEKPVVENFQVPQKKYLHICAEGYLIIDPLSDEPFKLDYEVKKNNVDIIGIIENNCTCTIRYADALTYSCDYYIEKTKKGLGKAPSYLLFDNAGDFYDSILYEEYKELLENEKFVFEIGEHKYSDLDGYEPVTDITELLEPDVAVVKISTGLGNQVCYYVLGEILGELAKKKIIYDDIENFFYTSVKVDELAKKEMNMLSGKVSKRIYAKLLSLGTIDALISKLYKDTLFVSRKAEFFRKLSKNFLYCWNLKELPGMLQKNSYIFLFLKLEQIIGHFALKNFTLKDYLQFPPFESKENIELSKLMQSCDSVVLNVRRGDFVSVGWETDTNYYVESIEKIMQIQQYKNKKFFIFSNDIPWCKENCKELGLDNVGDCEVIFVEGNKDYENYRDVQLMALGKILILSDSTFSCMAALYGENWEMLLCPNTKRFDIIQKYVRQNKYDIGSPNAKYNRQRGKRVPRSYSEESNASVQN